MNEKTLQWAAKQLEQLRKPALLNRANGPCVSCKFEPECQWAHEYEAVECKDWGAKEDDGECISRECEPPYGGKDDCEFYHNGLCR